jgi:hypothetical protein
MSSPASVLCGVLGRTFGVHVRPNEMIRALGQAGLVLSVAPVISIPPAPDVEDRVQ